MNEIKQALSSMNIKSVLSKDILNAEVCFAEDFPAFNGHFPDKKLLPGFVHIILIIFILESFYKVKFSLKEILQSKFKSPLLPLELSMITINISELNENGIINAKIDSDSVSKSTFKISLNKDS